MQSLAKGNDKYPENVPEPINLFHFLSKAGAEQCVSMAMVPADAVIHGIQYGCKKQAYLAMAFPTAAIKPATASLIFLLSRSCSNSSKGAAAPLLDLPSAFTATSAAAAPSPSCWQATHSDLQLQLLPASALF